MSWKEKLSKPVESVPDHKKLGKSTNLVAKKDFVISHNDKEFKIKSGDDLDHIPEIYLENLKTENVI